jgi:hypothetical protein
MGVIMRRVLSFAIVILAFTAVACPPAPNPDGSKPDTKKIVEIQPPETLEQLRPRIEGALEQTRTRDLLTTHGFWTVFHAILGLGLENTMLKDPKTKERFNAIDYICAGNEIRGLEFVPTKDGLDVTTANVRPDMQFIAQGHQDQFIAEMAQWGMKLDRKFKVQGHDYTFEDFIRQSRARASITKNQELSWAIIIIGQYYGTNHAWVNNANESLRYEQVVRYELDQSVTEAACGGTHRLFGLTWAYHLHLKNGGKKEGVWLDVARKIAEYQQIAKKLQNPDGTFSTDYFKGPGRAPDTEARISTTGHILEWLALAMTDDELRAPWMQNAVSGLSLLILNMGNESIDGGALYHAAHGLYIYHARVFGTPAPFLMLPPKN